MNLLNSSFIVMCSGYRKRPGMLLLDSVTVRLPPRDWSALRDAAFRGPVWRADLNRIDQLILGSDSRPDLPGITTWEVSMLQMVQLPPPCLIHK
jgi:hypothetical protein